MKVIEKDGLKILKAENGKQIRLINDVYIPATETEEEHIPYYTDTIYLSNSFDGDINEVYIEEDEINN